MQPEKKPVLRQHGPDLLITLGIVLSVLVVFGSVVGHEFLSWDDEDFLAANPAFRGVSAANLRYILTDTSTFGYYAPVTWLSFDIDHLLSGVSAPGVHLHNLMLHAVSAVLLYALALRLLAHAVPGRAKRGWAAVAALLFALHPLRVEPVAWATARGYLLAGLFAIAALLAYIRYAEARIAHRRASAMLAICTICYILSLLAIPVALGLPFVMLVLDVYPLRRRARERGAAAAGVQSLWLEKTPLLVVAAVAAVLTPLAKASQGSLANTYSPIAGLALAGYNLTFGILRSVLPIRLSPLYQLYPGFSPAEPVYLITGLFVVTLTVSLVLVRRRFPAGLASWICYVLLMLPVSGLVHYGLQITADRYTYVAGITLALLVAGIGAAWQQRHPSQRPAATAIAALTIVALAVGARRYTAVWQDSTRLWQRVVDLDDRSYTGLNNLAIELQENGEFAEALALFRRAAEVNPAYPPLRNNLGHIAAARGRLEEAIAHYEASLRFKPGLETRIMYASVLARAGRIPEAVAQARLVEGPDTPSSKLHALITGKLIDQGHDAAAVAVTRAGLGQDPGDPVLLNNLAWLLATSYDPACRSGSEALAAAEKMMVQMEGRRPPPQFFATLGAANAEQGRFDEAIRATENAIKLSRQYREAGRIDEYTGYLLEYRAHKPHRELPPPPSPWAALVTPETRSA